MRTAFDHYTITARILPALFATAPLGVLLFVWMPGESFAGAGLLASIGTAGGLALLAQLGRDQGKRKEAELWTRWGGTPTTRLLRFRDSPNRIVLNQWRTKLETAIGHRLPSEEEEAADPLGADQHYEAAINFLLEATRDRSTFPLVFAENVNYGCRRNLWGLKPWGILVALSGAVGAWSFFLYSAGIPPGDSWLEVLVRNPDEATITRLVGAVANTVAIGIWLRIVTPEWVRTAAEAYAQRLLSAVNTLDA